MGNACLLYLSRFAGARLFYPVVASRMHVPTSFADPAHPETMRTILRTRDSGGAGGGHDET
eukprot:3167637-Pyramimonas_sp.AAC.1